MAAMKMGLDPAISKDIKAQLIIVMKEFFGHITSVTLYISGSKMDQIMRAFYLFFTRMKVPFTFEAVPPKAAQLEEVKKSHQQSSPRLESSESDDDIGSSSDDDSSSNSSSEHSEKSLAVAEEQKEPPKQEVFLYRKLSDREILRNILLNVLYYYNCKEKVDAVMAKIEGKGKKEKKEDADEDSIGSTDTKAELLQRAKAL